jgi:hypothetical protein
MPDQNIINNHMPPAEVTQAFTLIGQLEALIQPYLRNLSPEENLRLGSISEKNKLFINKVNDLHRTQPALQSPDVDWAEFDDDFESRFNYEAFAMRLAALTKAITETRRLHDYDNYQVALLDYDYAKYKDRTAPGLGYDSKVEQLGQFFEGGGPRTVGDNSQAPTLPPSPPMP